jgi:hypothetical protein
MDMQEWTHQVDRPQAARCGARIAPLLITHSILLIVGMYLLVAVVR